MANKAPFFCDLQGILSIDSPHISWRCYRCRMYIEDVTCNLLPREISWYLTRQIALAEEKLYLPRCAISLSNHIKIFHWYEPPPPPEKRPWIVNKKRPVCLVDSSNGDQQQNNKAARRV